MATKTELVSQIESLLGDRHAGTYAECGQHVPEPCIEEATELAREAGADCLITVGGGSPVDAGKNVAFNLLADQPREAMPQIAIPTTLSAGEFGEICVRGYNVMQGLYKVEREITFDADGFYHTGDAGHFDEDGYLFFRARLGDMIKTAGANVTPREVEVALEEIDGIRAAYVVGVPHPDRGQNVAAAIVPKRGTTLSSEEIRSALREVLSAYKVPRHYFFYESEDLPFTDSGKIQKNSLVAMIVGRLEDEGAA